VLLSLSIKDFVLIEDAGLDFGAGLTVLSGETGAGKTLLTQALGLLLGERAADGLVKESAAEALIQGVFEISPSQSISLSDDARSLLDLQTGELFAARRLARTGRNTCFLNGVSVPLSRMAEVLGDLISFSGQHEHRRLLRPDYQLGVVDAFAGTDQQHDLQEYGATWQETRRIERRLQEMRTEAERQRRDVELLEFQLGELRAASLDPAEESDLETTQRLLAQVEAMLGACTEAATAIRGDDTAVDAGGLVAAARARLTPFQGLHADLDDVLSCLADASEIIDDAARSLRSVSAALEPDPERLAEIDERLRLYSELARKYGGTTEAAIAYLHEAERRLDDIGSSAEEITGLESHLEILRSRCVELAAALSERRRAAAAALEEAVAGHLADLGMTDGALHVRLTHRRGWEELGATGADELEFLLAPNRGVSPRSLARVASGGELSRVLLAVKTALRGFEPAETVVFDEIDAGVGGHTATAVGAKLKEISTAGQVIVVTHLPQVAAFADAHYVIRKEDTEAGAVTRLEALDDEGAMDELCRMMGGSPGDPAAMAHARTLKDRAAMGLID
jgi:DNA repair protein RecN (Recombination protein N)